MADEAAQSFLLTDVVGSTRLWYDHPGVMPGVTARHDDLLTDLITAHGGRVVKGTGDGLLAVFSDPASAVWAAVDGQIALGREDWPVDLHVRMAVNHGPAVNRDNDYFGPAVIECARLLNAAHGGQILITESAGEAVAEGIGLVDLGKHRLRDLTAPVRVFQPAVDGLPSEFPPLRALRAFAHNLPVQLTSFIGRTDDQAALTELLLHDRMVTLTGPGGSGKTRLAVHQAAQLVDAFEDGCWWVELLSADSPDEVAERVATSLGIQQIADEPIAETLERSLRARKLLLVLDNCEHVIEATAALADRLLRRTDIRLMATSREPLRVAGETIFEVGPLDVPDPSTTMDELASIESVRLLRDRAVQAGSSIDLTVDAAAVTTICRRLEGIPLAIELAAARLRAFTPTEIAGRLDHALSLLTIGIRGGDRRHATLQATIGWSVDLLTAEERGLYERLSVFPSSWTLEAARNICAGAASQLCDEIHASLVDKSLITASVFPNGERRFRYLETVREFALGLIDPHLHNELRGRFVDHYRDFMLEHGGPADEVPPGPDPFHDERDARLYDRLANEAKNVTFALETALKLGRPEDVLRIFGWGGWLALYVRPEFIDRIDALVAGAVAAVGDSYADEVSAAMRALCFVVSAAPNAERFLERCDDSEQRSLRLGKDRSALLAGLMAGAALYRLGCIKDGSARIAAVVEQATDDVIRGMALMDLAGSGEARWERAQHGWHLTGLDRVTEFLWPEDVWSQSMRAARAGRYQKALDLSQRAVQAARARRIPILDAHCLETMAEVLAAMGRLEEAVEAAVEAVELGRRLLGPNYASSRSLIVAAHVARLQGDSDRAGTYLEDAEATAERNGLPHHVGFVLLHRALLERDCGRLDDAEDLCGRADRFFLEIGRAELISFVDRARASVAARRSDPRRVFELLTDTIDDVDGVDRPEAIEWLALAAVAFAQAGSVTQAGCCAGVVDRERRELGIVVPRSDLELEDRSFAPLRDRADWRQGWNQSTGRPLWDALRQAVREVRKRDETSSDPDLRSIAGRA